MTRTEFCVSCESGSPGDAFGGGVTRGRCQRTQAQFRNRGGTTLSTKNEKMKKNDEDTMPAALWQRCSGVRVHVFFFESGFRSFLGLAVVHSFEPMVSFGFPHSPLLHSLVVRRNVVVEVWVKIRICD